MSKFDKPVPVTSIAEKPKSSTKPKRAFNSPFLRIKQMESLKSQGYEFDIGNFSHRVLFDGELIAQGKTQVRGMSFGGTTASDRSHHIEQAVISAFIHRKKNIKQ